MMPFLQQPEKVTHIHRLAALSNTEKIRPPLPTEADG